MTSSPSTLRLLRHLGVDKFAPGDVVLTRNPRWYARLIRFGTQRRGEARTVVNHAGIIVDTRGTMVEALGTVKRHNIVAAYEAGSSKSSVAIFRPLNIPSVALADICKAAEQYIGDRYGWGKIALHVLDGLLGRVWIPPVFSRLGRVDSYPICSYLVAKAYAAAGYDFGVKAQMATPDHIWDFCVSRSDRFECVRLLERVIAWPAL